MPDQQPRYLPQVIDFLGFLEAKLRDLQGVSTLVYELIQNADDVKDAAGNPGASQIVFDIRDDALVVTNDGVFRDDDFGRLQRVASGGKRDEIGTTGAFGIGFISVYQITDYPEISSNGRRWVICPDAPQDSRIQVWKEDTEATLFRLPWAFDAASNMRQKLRLAPVLPEQLDTFQEEMTKAITLGALFLKQIKDLQVRRNGKLMQQVRRIDVEDDQLMLQIGGDVQIWRLFYGEFDAQAKCLRTKHSQIEPKRRSQIVVAIPDEGLTSGRLFAVLPSETTIPLPFHINADFFPSSDRKHILFSEDYQGEWNRTAIQAAARALAAGLEKLPEIMKPKSLWRLLKSLNDCRGEREKSLGNFWGEASPRLSQLPLVYTITSQWIKSGAARLLESDAELVAAPIFSGLGIQIVHSDLREHFSFLRQREIGVPLLSAQDVANALKGKGIHEGQLLTQAPEQLRSLEAWQTLWKALVVILKRPQAQDREITRYTLRHCSIALDETGALYPPCQVFRGDEETRQIFKTVQWLSHEVEESGLLNELVDSFSLYTALTFLEGIAGRQLEAAWQAGDFDIGALYRWFESRKTEIIKGEKLLSKLRSLAIWPSAGHLRPLDGLYIPSNFEDPFKISALVDIEALGERREFLKDLGVQELTFGVYAREQVPRVLQEKRDLTVEQRRQIVQLLAERMGELRDDAATQEVIKPLPLVECTDGTFRPAGSTYLPGAIMDVLDKETIFVAATPSEHQEAVFALYHWLGIAKEPRPEDLLARIRSICAVPPTPETQDQIAVIFKYLVTNWGGWRPPQHQEFSALRDMAWLPGTQRGTERWYKPRDLYAIFQQYLFETQANFLALPRELQATGATAKFIDFLEIQQTPSPALVVKHLLQCSQGKQPVNPQVYRFLNQKENVRDSALDRLRDQACLLLPDGSYVHPDQVFWNQHPFGKFRYRLGPEFRQYDALLDRLKIKESPCVQDYIQVLLDISKQYGQAHKILDEETHAVVLHCWETLSRACEKGEIQLEAMGALCDQPVIPNEQNILIRPTGIFFEDRPKLKEKLPGLGPDVIKRPSNAWRAMEAVGVKLLGQAVNVELVKALDTQPAAEVSRHFAERRELIQRVIGSESMKASGTEDIDIDVLDRLSFEMTRVLEIRYVLDTRSHRHSSAPESVRALLRQTEPDIKTLVICYDDDQIPWSDIAREIAYAVKPSGEIGGLACGIKEALLYETFEEASRALDELGFPRFESPTTTPIPERPAISGFGGTELSQEHILPDVGHPAATANGPVPPESKVSDQPITPPIPSGREVPPSPPESQNSPSVLVQKPPQSINRSKSHIVTYVSHESEEEGAASLAEESERQARRTEVEKAGIERAMAYERGHGREPEEMPHLNPGFDIRSVDSRGEIRYIEVKALAGRWEGSNPAQLTPNEFEMAQEREDEYWLYVVEFAASAEARVYPIQNPVGWVQRYLFDNGWMKLAKETPTQVEHGGNM